MPPYNCSYKAKTSQSQKWTWSHYTYWTFSPSFSWTLENFQLGLRYANLICLFTTDFLPCQINSENYLKVSWGCNPTVWTAEGRGEKLCSNGKGPRKLYPHRLQLLEPVLRALCAKSVFLSPPRGFVCCEPFWLQRAKSNRALSLGWMRSFLWAQSRSEKSPKGEWYVLQMLCTDTKW